MFSKRRDTPTPSSDHHPSHRGISGETAGQRALLVWPSDYFPHPHLLGPTTEDQGVLLSRQPLPPGPSKANDPSVILLKNCNLQTTLLPVPVAKIRCSFDEKGSMHHMKSTVPGVRRPRPQLSPLTVVCHLEQITSLCSVPPYVKCDN